MENANKLKETNGELAAFREEIAEIARNEAEKGNTADFSGIVFQPGELNEFDMDIWHKLKSKKINLNDFIRYRSYFDGSEGETRERFLYYMANKVNALMHSDNYEA